MMAEQMAWGQDNRTKHTMKLFESLMMIISFDRLHTALRLMYGRDVHSPLSSAGNAVPGIYVLLFNGIMECLSLVPLPVHFLHCIEVHLAV